jgi:hypothetical protein
VANDIVSRLDISRNYSSPDVVVGHQPVGRPDTILVNSVLGELEELQLIDIDIGDISSVRGQPRGNGSLVAVEPVGPVKGDIATGANGSYVERARIVDSVASDFGTVRVHGWTDVSAAEGDAFWNRIHRGIDTDIPSWVAV